MAGDIPCSLTRDQAGTTVCSDTAELTMVLTWGRSPEIAAITKDVEPWQCANTFSSAAPACSSTSRTAGGKS